MDPMVLEMGECKPKWPGFLFFLEAINWGLQTQICLVRQNGERKTIVSHHVVAVDVNSTEIFWFVKLNMNLKMPLVENEN